MTDRKNRRHNDLSFVFLSAIHKADQDHYQNDDHQSENTDHYYTITPIDQRKNKLYHIQEFDLSLKNSTGDLAII